MIDRAARNTLADAIRALVARQITNDAFEDRILFQSPDLAVTEVFQSGAWYLYDDLHEHRLVGHYRVPPEARPEVARWILFLKSEHEYAWPSSAGFVGLFWLFGSALTLGLLARLRRHLWRRVGDIEVWPFLRREHYEKALSHPPYLGGSA